MASENTFGDIWNTINAMKDGRMQVDERDNTHDYQTILMKLCHVDLEEDTILEMLDEILSQDPDVNMQDNCGRTALTHACISQNYAIVDALLYDDATRVDTIDKSGCTPLAYAIKAGDGPMVDKLLSHPKARNSALLLTKCNGKTPLELATLNGNQAIIDIIKTCIRYSSGYSDSCEMERERSNSSLPIVNPLKKRRNPAVLAFAAAKSHSDSVLLKRDKSLGFSVESQLCAPGLSRGFHNPTEFGGGSRTITRNHRADDSHQNSPDELPALGNSFDDGDRTRTSRRRGSLSLPDLSLPPDCLSRFSNEVSMVSNPTTDSETTGSINDDVFSDEEDFNDDFNEDEMRTNITRSRGRRKNSISLPDLRESSGFLVSSSPSYSAPIDSSRPVYSATSTIDSGIDSQTRRDNGCRKKANKLHLPDIHMCNSPSLPALDKTSPMTLRKVSNCRSVQNLDLSVRKPIGGKGDNHTKLMNRRRTDTMQSIM